MKNKANLPSLRTKNLVVKELSGELLIYDLETNKAYCLNETAYMIMDECDGNKSINEALKSLNRKLKSSIDEDIVWMTIGQFKKFNLLKNNSAFPVQETKLSRRKILQSATVLGIAIPVITSLVAPLAVHALSCIAANQPCTQSGLACCRGICINTEVGPTGFQCIG